MPGNRKAATDFILKSLEAILPGNTDTPRYKAYLESLSDKDFDQLMKDYKSGEKYLTLTAPNGAKAKLSLERNYAYADKIGVKFHQKLWYDGDEDTPASLMPIERLVLKLPMRLASQRLDKKKSIPKTQRVINTLTGQPTGESKGASISLPELRVCAAQGLDNTMVELIKYRGGDQRGNAALNASLIRTGRANLNTLSHFASGVVSSSTLKSYMTGCHLKINL